MVIDFSKGSDYWLGIIRTLLQEVDDLVFALFGIHVFVPAEAPEATDETTTTD